MKNYLLVFVFLICNICMYAQSVPHDGVLDSTFGYNGVYIDTVPLPVANSFIGIAPIGMAVVDDSIVVMGGMNHALGLMKFTKNGFPDHAFCVDGNDSFTNQTLYQLNYPLNITAQADGKIIYVTSGTDQYVIARFLPNGVPDSTFNNTGVDSTEINASYNTIPADMVIQPDGKYVICGIIGNGTIAIVRYNTDGRPDTGFCSCSSGEVVIHSSHIGGIGKMAIQADGKILITGSKKPASFIDTPSKIFVLRCNTDGTPDMSFGDSGFVFNDLQGLVGIDYTVLLPNGKTLLAGAGIAAIVIARLNPDGTVDSSFGTNGTSRFVFDPYTIFSAATLQKDGKILIACSPNVTSQLPPTITRFMPDGAVDSSFGLNGVTTIDATRQIACMALQSNGDIVVACDYEDNPDDPGMLLARYTAHYNNAGVTTVSANQPHISVYPNPSAGVYNIAAQNIAGSATLIVCDITGRTLYTKQHDFGISSTTTVDLAGYATGIYFIKVMTFDGNAQVVKLLKE